MVLNNQLWHFFGIPSNFEMIRGNTNNPGLILMLYILVFAWMPPKLSVISMHSLLSLDQQRQEKLFLIWQQKAI